MILLTITFLLTLVLSFTIVMRGTRTTASSKSVQVRLTTIRHSIQARRTGTNGVDLGADEEQNYVIRLGVFLQRYQFANKLQVLQIGRAHV